MVTISPLLWRGVGGEASTYNLQLWGTDETDETDETDILQTFFYIYNNKFL